MIAALWFAAAAAPQATADATMVVLPGYDLFTTLPGSQFGIDLDGDNVGAAKTLMSFASLPLGRFDFGAGLVDTGATDTVVRRTGVATPDQPRMGLELVALQMRSVAPPGFFVTLQSDRGRNVLDPPDGPPSVGTMDVAFDPDGRGGTILSEFLVLFDVRHGSPTGPIVSTGGLTLTGKDAWRRDAPAAPVGGCHDHVPGSPLARHCIMAATERVMACNDLVVEAIPAIAGVNHHLNGVDDTSDFHLGGPVAEAACASDDGSAFAAVASDEAQAAAAANVTPDGSFRVDADARTATGHGVRVSAGPDGVRIVPDVG